MPALRQYSSEPSKYAYNQEALTPPYAKSTRLGFIRRPCNGRVPYEFAARAPGADHATWVRGLSDLMHYKLNLDGAIMAPYKKRMKQEHRTSLRLSPEEFEAISRARKRDGDTISLNGWIRIAVREKLEREDELHNGKHS